MTALLTTATIPAVVRVKSPLPGLTIAVERGRSEVGLTSTRYGSSSGARSR